MPAARDFANRPVIGHSFREVLVTSTGPLSEWPMFYRDEPNFPRWVRISLWQASGPAQIPPAVHLPVAPQLHGSRVARPENAEALSPTSSIFRSSDPDAGTAVNAALGVRDYRAYLSRATLTSFAPCVWSPSARTSRWIVPAM